VLHDPETHLIPVALRAAAGLGPELQVFGSDYPTPDGTSIRDYIHVNDLASAHLKALERLAAGNESFAVNLGTGHGHSVLEVISAVEKATGEYCFFMGNDDVMCPGALENVAGVLERHQNVGLVLNNYAWFDSVPERVNQEVALLCG